MELGNRLFQDFRNLGSPETVWNLGNIVISPGAANVVPAKAELSVEFRDTTPEVLTRLEAAVAEAIGHLAASSPCVVESRPVLNLEPAANETSVTQQVIVIPLREGRLYLNVSASFETDDGTISTVAAIPVQVGTGTRVLQEHGELEVDEDGEAVRVLSSD